MRTHKLALASAALTATLLITGCTQTDNSNETTGTDQGSSTSSSSTSSEQFNAADEMFVTMMIPHHEQAIEMSDLVLNKDGVDERVVELAQQIKDAQGPEIKTMQGWLKEWGVADGGSSMEGMDHGDMSQGDGMMSEESMTALESATGVDATRLFLTGMIEHHEGAIDMAKPVIDSGQNPDVIKLAEQVIEGQSAEITTMQDILKTL